jgi:predicted nucleotidyltransferase
MLDLRIRQEIRARLEEAFGARLKKIVLYGSEARDEAAPDSDIDLLVVLAGNVKLGPDLKVIVNALYPLQLEVIRPLEAFPIAEADFEAEDYAMIRDAKQEGVLL